MFIILSKLVLSSLVSMSTNHMKQGRNLKRSSDMTHLKNSTSNPSLAHRSSRITFHCTSHIYIIQIAALIFWDVLPFGRISFSTKFISVFIYSVILFIISSVKYNFQILMGALNSLSICARTSILILKIFLWAVLWLFTGFMSHNMSLPLLTYASFIYLFYNFVCLPYF